MLELLGADGQVHQRIERRVPRDGRLVASREVGGGMLGFPAPDLVYEVRQDELGRVHTQLSRLSLTPR